MTNEFEARFVWANSDGKGFVVFVLCPVGEQTNRESFIDCRVQRFVEYRSVGGDKITDLSELPHQIRQQVEVLLGTKCAVQQGVRMGAIKYIESPFPTPSSPPSPGTT